MAEESHGREAWAPREFFSSISARRDYLSRDWTGGEAKSKIEQIEEQKLTKRLKAVLSHGCVHMRKLS